MSTATTNTTPSPPSPSPARPILIIVGSTNPCKIDAVRQAFTRIYPPTQTHTHTHQPSFHIEGIDVNSGVTAQPFNDEETYTGALTRAKNAAAAWKEKKQKEGEKEDSSSSSLLPDFTVGLEGGVRYENAHTDTNTHTPSLHCFAWLVIYEPKTERIGAAKTASFLLPPEITRLVTEKKMELGAADDLVFQRRNSKQGEGTVGRLTHGVIDRAEYYNHALILAFIPFINRELYE